MALNPLNSSNLEPLALKGLMVHYCCWVHILNIQCWRSLLSLFVQCYNTLVLPAQWSTLGNHAFPVITSWAWNSLPAPFQLHSHYLPSDNRWKHSCIACLNIFDMFITVTVWTVLSHVHHSITQVSTFLVATTTNRNVKNTLLKH